MAALHIFDDVQKWNCFRHGRRAGFLLGFWHGLRKDAWFVAPVCVVIYVHCFEARMTCMGFTGTVQGYTSVCCQPGYNLRVFRQIMCCDRDTI